MNEIMIIWIIFIIFFIIILAIVLLQLFSIWPFNVAYMPMDPRTWKHIKQYNDWLIPEFDYAPYNTDPRIEYVVPIYDEYISLYCSDPNLSETERKIYCT